ncbi:MAG: DNA polymerase III subunit gamma/tau [Fretibacterium sp.]|nr:DNA polymerase III subunit gamma/tau [Fretibacterium sp.]
MRVSVSLYRQYRPQTFAEVVGQDAAVDVLSHALSSGRIGHAYLFSGPRGCGKTSVARILAKALNCSSPNGTDPCGQCPNCVAITAGECLDVVEIDGASNNSVDEVRELKSHVTLAPFSSKYKVYIIDEVHMLSTAAFNALLKTLEEPPSYVIFILATTEPHKVPVTIRSRCQHIPFHSIGARRIWEQITRVCEWEKVKAQPEALWEIARQAEGAMRDALSMLEQVINRASGEVTLSDVEATLGAGSRPALERWLAGLHEGGSVAYTGLREMFEGGSSQRVFEELFSLVRNLWLTARWPDVVDSLDVSEQEKIFLQKEAPRWKPDGLRSLLAALVGLINQARQGVRSDVLTGLLMLALDRPEPQEKPSVPPLPAPQEKSFPKRRQRIETPQPETTPLPPAAQECHQEGEEAPRSQSSQIPTLDWHPVPEEKTAQLLSHAQEADFTLYCGLLDASFFEANGHLLLDMKYSYSYEVLCLGRNCSGLYRALPGYTGIYLRHDDETFVCSAAPPSHVEDKPRADESAGREGGRKEKAPREKTASFTPPRGENSEETKGTPEPAGAGLPFGELMKDISRVMRGEVILVRHKDEGTGDGGNDEPSEESSDREDGSEA